MRISVPTSLVFGDNPVSGSKEQWLRKNKFSMNAPTQNTLFCQLQAVNLEHVPLALSMCLSF